MKLEVGKSYIREDKRITKIIDRSISGRYVSENGLIYSHTGKMVMCDTLNGCGLDLVEEVGK